MLLVIMLIGLLLTHFPYQSILILQRFTKINIDYRLPNRATYDYYYYYYQDPSNLLLTWNIEIFQVVIKPSKLYFIIQWNIAIFKDPSKLILTTGFQTEQRMIIIIIIKLDEILETLCLRSLFLYSIIHQKDVIEFLKINMIRA